MPDMTIAALLNRAGKRTGQDNTWTESRVRAFRNDHGIAVYCEGERAERGELNLLEAAAALGTCDMTVLRFNQEGDSPGSASMQGSPLGHQSIGRRRPKTLRDRTTPSANSKSRPKNLEF